MSSKEFSFIGSLSIQDAIIFSKQVENCQKVLEFGCGASTQIIAQCSNKDSLIYSVDTNQKWMDGVKEFITNEMSINKNISFVSFENKNSIKEKDFDLIFDDGLAKNRLDFALWSWSKLKSNNGKLIIHDTRRPGEINLVSTIFQKYGNEISNISVNPNHSSLTIITKKELEPYSDWNVVEKRQSWMQSIFVDKRPENWKEIIKNKVNENYF